MASELLLLAQALLATIFLTAAVGKFLRSEEFLEALRLSGLTAVVVPMVAVCVPTIELGLFLSLLLTQGAMLVGTMAVATFTLLAFTMWLLWVYARRRNVKCGCFGTSGASIGLQTIARNLAFLSVSVVGLVLAGHTVVMTPPATLPTIICIVSIGQCFALILAAKQGLPALLLTTKELNARFGVPPSESRSIGVKS